LTADEIDEFKVVVQSGLVDKTPVDFNGFSISYGEYRKLRNEIKNYNYLTDKNSAGLGFVGWASMPRAGSPLWFIIVTSIILGVGIGVLAQPQLVVRFMTVKSNRELNRAVLMGGIFILFMVGVAYVSGALSNSIFYKNDGVISIVKAGGNPDKIIPILIGAVMPSWFNYLFILTILSAGMSTVSSLFHVMGTSIGRDLYEGCVKGGSKGKHSILITRIGIIITVLFSVRLGYILPIGIIARATAIFFGVMASAFLPLLIAGIFTRKVTPFAAVASSVTGFIVSAIWLTFFQIKEASALGLCKLLFNKAALTITSSGTPGILAFVDAIVIALPISTFVLIVVSLFTKNLNKGELDRIFKKV